MDEVRLAFLGTRADTDAHTVCHDMHSVLQVARGARKPVIIDCGEDWLGQVSTVP